MIQRICIVLLCLFVLGLPARGDEPPTITAVPVDTAAPFAGAWQGLVRAAGDTETWLYVDMNHDDGGYTATLYSPDAMLIGQQRYDATVEGETISFRFPVMRQRATLRATLDKSEQTLTGTVRMAAADADDEPATVNLQRVYTTMMVPDARAYTGEIVANGITIGMTFVFATTDTGITVGHMDVPMQGISGLPLRDVEREENSITAAVPIPGGASIELAMDQETGNFRGTIHQQGMEFPLDLKHDAAYVPGGLKRPQHPDPPYPYRTRDLTISHPEGFEIAGTLTIPDDEKFGTGPFATAILISGSGQQDRDETLLGHKPFLVISHALTNAGIATFRYDDRGVGESGGLDTVNAATTQDWADDAALVYQHLLTLEEIDRDRIGIIGHSEGGMIAPMVADTLRGSSHPVDFLVLLAGPGVVGGDLLVKQVKLGWMAMGLPEDVADEHGLMFAEVVRESVETGDADAVFTLLRPIGTAQVEHGLATNDEELRDTSLRMQSGIFTSPWMRWFLAYDPAPALRRIDCPVLAMIGEKDLQVWHAQNLDPMIDIFEQTGVDYTARRYPDLNHLFQHADTGSMAEYGQIETTFDEDALADLVSWVTRTVAVDRTASPTE